MVVSIFLLLFFFFKKQRVKNVQISLWLVNKRISLRKEEENTTSVKYKINIPWPRSASFSRALARKAVLKQLFKGLLWLADMVWKVARVSIQSYGVTGVTRNICPAWSCHPRHAVLSFSPVWRALWGFVHTVYWLLFKFFGRGEDPVLFYSSFRLLPGILFC